MLCSSRWQCRLGCSDSQKISPPLSPDLTSRRQCYNYVNTMIIAYMIDAGQNEVDDRQCVFSCLCVHVCVVVVVCVRACVCTCVCELARSLTREFHTKICIIFYTSINFIENKMRWNNTTTIEVG